MGQKSHVAGLGASASQSAAIKVSVMKWVSSKALKKGKHTSQLTHVIAARMQFLMSC